MILIVIFYLLFSRPVYAANPTITLSDLPANTVLGDTFPLTINVTGDIGASYYYKLYGGPTGTDDSVQTFYNGSFLNYTSSWVSFPVLSLGASGSFSGTIYGKTKDVSGAFIIKTRLNNGSNIDSANSLTIQVIAPSPTPTVPSPTPTNTQNPTTVPTNTPVPTSTPTRTPTPTPISSPTPTSEPTPTNMPPTPTGLPIDPISLIPQITPISPVTTKSPNSQILPTIFIIIGGLLLVVPLIISKLKK